VTTQPLVFYRSSTTPANQFYFWPATKTAQARMPSSSASWTLIDRRSGRPRVVEQRFESVTELASATCCIVAGSCVRLNSTPAWLR